FMKPKLKKAPEFKTEDAERAFWAEHDSSEYLDWSAAEPLRLPRLKPSTETISLRLPKHLLERIRLTANSRDVPYQSLIKLWLQEKLQEGRNRS
ncbi:MAG: BrnA antitoxin family protein, partial [Pseudomonadales bacterium]